jgi:hypothetical protein
MEKGKDTKGTEEKEKQIIFSIVFDGSYYSSTAIERQEVLGTTTGIRSFDTTLTS